MVQPIRGVDDSAEGCSFDASWRRQSNAAKVLDVLKGNLTSCSTHQTSTLEPSGTCCLLINRDWRFFVLFCFILLVWFQKKFVVLLALIPSPSSSSQPLHLPCFVFAAGTPSWVWCQFLLVSTLLSALLGFSRKVQPWYVHFWEASGRRVGLWVLFHYYKGPKKSPVSSSLSVYDGMWFSLWTLTHQWGPLSFKICFNHLHADEQEDVCRHNYAKRKVFSI